MGQADGAGRLVIGRTCGHVTHCICLLLLGSSRYQTQSSICAPPHPICAASPLLVLSTQ